MGSIQPSGTACHRHNSCTCPQTEQEIVQYLFICMIGMIPLTPYVFLMHRIEICTSMHT